MFGNPLAQKRLSFTLHNMSKHTTPTGCTSAAEQPPNCVRIARYQTQAILNLPRGTRAIKLLWSRASRVLCCRFFTDFIINEKNVKLQTTARRPPTVRCTVRTAITDSSLNFRTLKGDACLRCWHAWTISGLSAGGGHVAL